MSAALVKGNNRRSKTALFLVACICLALAPHLIAGARSFLPGITLAFLLGGYGLKTVLRYRSKETSFKASNYGDILQESELPSVDVVIAARDEEAVVERLVNRLASLNYPKDKLFFTIVDDGSRDQTPYLLKELSHEFSQLNVISRSRNAGGGKSGALNKALNHIEGEWLLILDADAQLNENSLIRLVTFAIEGGWSAVQLRKSVINSKVNLLTRCQAMEMAMDAVIQSGRFGQGGVVELRGNGQFVKRKDLEKCGGFNEDTVTDDLDLSFRLLLSGAMVNILWDPPVEEEAVESVSALWKQRQRWAEGGLQRFFDYWPLLISNKLNFLQRRDLTCFFLLQYVLPTVSLLDCLFAFTTASLPNYWPLSFVAFSISGLAFWRGCNGLNEGPEMPNPIPLNLFLAIIYLAHWFIVIPWVTLRMAIFPKKLVWIKTIHQG